LSTNLRTSSCRLLFLRTPKVGNSDCVTRECTVIWKCVVYVLLLHNSLFVFSSFSHVFVCAWDEMICRMKDVTDAVEGVAVDPLLQL
jgi:hypothetical protein